MKKHIIFLFIIALLSSCSSRLEIVNCGKHYRKHKDFKSLSRTVELMPKTITTIYVKRLLGKPIDNGFDYRYLVDSIGVNNCTVGAVFYIDNQGKITNRWVDEICE